MNIAQKTGSDPVIEPNPVRSGVCTYPTGTYVRTIVILNDVHMLRGWTGGAGIRGMGVKEAGNGGRGGRGREILGRALYQNLLYFTDFTLFLCTSMQ